MSIWWRAEALERIADLVGYGAPFDRKADGSLALGREAAHSLPRIVHVKGDGAGAAISATLAARASEADCITLLEGFHAIELAMEGGRVTGIFARSGIGHDARLILFRARAVILATGGLGALYAVTTNPLEARGEGLGMAARAGALIADPEFVQFHPTAIAVGRDPAPLATEALRGEGAVLIDDRGNRFMTDLHKDAELAPRDIVARAIHRQILSGRKVFLDCRTAIGAEFPHHFPTIYAACMAAGIDPVAAPIPVAPAAHYHMGGIASDAAGRSSLPGLWAVGECASTGLHGANRLASNSLLEGLIFGARVADDVRGIAGRAEAAGPATGAAAVCLACPAPCAARRHEPRCGAGTRCGRPRRCAGGYQTAGDHQHRAGAAEHGGGGQAGDGGRAGAQGIARRPLAQRFPQNREGRQPHLHDAGRCRPHRRQPDPAAPRQQMSSALDFTRPPPRLLIEAHVRAALEEDLGRAGDITIIQVPKVNGRSGWRSGSPPMLASRRCRAPPRLARVSRPRIWRQCAPVSPTPSTSMEHRSAIAAQINPLLGNIR